LSTEPSAKLATPPVRAASLSASGGKQTDCCCPAKPAYPDRGLGQNFGKNQFSTGFSGSIELKAMAGIARASPPETPVS
jgi:hypothetical protein